jgi:hypothetical protein
MFLMIFWFGIWFSKKERSKEAGLKPVSVAVTSLVAGEPSECG